MCLFIAYSVGHRPSLLDFHRQVLFLPGDGTYELMNRDEYRQYCLKNNVTVATASEDYQT